jgi:hypothetical protein
MASRLSSMTTRMPWRSLSSRRRGDAVELLLFHELGDLFDEAGLVDLERQLVDDDGARPPSQVFESWPGRAPRCARGRSRRPRARPRGRRSCPRWGSRGPGMCSISSSRRSRVGRSGRRGVDDLAEVVRRDLGRHADRDALAAVHQQVREGGGQDVGLFGGAVEVRREVTVSFSMSTRSSSASRVIRHSVYR